MIRQFAGLLAVLATLALAGCGYNDLQRQDEGIKAAWSEVLNQYQRRADLVPNLVNTVKGYAAQEEKVLTEVTNARASVAGIKATPELVNDPVAFQKFIKAQGELTGALSRLLVVSENYPQLKSGRAVPRPDGAARGHREPDHRRAQPVHQERPGVQHDRAAVPDQPHGDDLQDGCEAQLHGGERGHDQRAAQGRFQQARGDARRTGHAGGADDGGGAVRAQSRRLRGGCSEEGQLTGRLDWRPAPAVAIVSIA